MPGPLSWCRGWRMMGIRFGQYLLLAQERKLLGPTGILEVGARSFDILVLLLEHVQVHICQPVSPLFSLSPHNIDKLAYHRGGGESAPNYGESIHH